MIKTFKTIGFITRSRENYKLKKKNIYLCTNKIMTIQRAHISLNLCDCPVVKESFGYEWMISDEAKCACFENYLP